MFRVAILVAAVAAVTVCTGGAVAADGPMADAGLDQTVTVETTVQLDGTGSGHPDGAITAYEWTIRTPDGRVIEPDCADCERSQFTPSTAGRYVVNLTVTGPGGTQSTDTLYVYVEDGGPEVELSGDETPDPNQAVTYTASARSPDAELEEIAWAVEDQIVTVRSLDGSTDESELSLAFSETETHRVQVVVRDSNGRTAYDQLYVQPQSGSPSESSWGEVEPPDCTDSGYAARNAEECWDLNVSVSTPVSSEPDDSPDPETFEVRYDTEGYYTLPSANTVGSDSSFVGITGGEIGVDGGENAPWRQSGLERIYDGTVDGISRFLFGQEEQTVTCELSGQNDRYSSCAQQVDSLENTGRSLNQYSESKTGGYAEYGLQGGERISGIDPTNLEEGQRAEVTIVIQEGEDGIVDRAVERTGNAVDRVFGSDDGDGEDVEVSSRSYSSDRSNSGRPSGHGGLTSGLTGINPSTGTSSQENSSSGKTGGSTSSSTSSTGFTERNDRGLLA